MFWDRPENMGQYRDDRQHVFLDGKSNLVIRATRNPDGKYVSGKLKGTWWGGINTTWEARIKFNCLTLGCWPAWWLSNDHPVVGGEIDMVEWYGNANWPSGTTVHAREDGTSFATQPFPVDSAWHTWRVTWNDAGMYFWLDYVAGAQPYFEVPANSLDDWPFNLPDYRVFPVLNLAVAGSGGGDPAGGTYPATCSSTTCASGRHRLRAMPASRLGQAEVVAQGRALVLGAEHAALLQQRHDLVDELVEAAGRDVRDQDEAVAGVGLDEVVDRVGDRGRGADEGLPAGDLDDQLADGQLLGLGALPATRWRWRAGRGTSGRWPGPGRWCSRRRSGRSSGSGPSGSWSDRSRFQSCSRNLIAVCAADLLPADLVGQSPRASASVSPSTNVAAGRISSWSWRAAVRGEAALDVGVERLARPPACRAG